MRFGVHCSLKNGFTGALLEAKQKKCEAMQIFTRSPRMWKMRVPSNRETAEFRTARKKLRIWPVAVHVPYLPNIATSKRILYRKSLNALIEDLEISERLGADFVVIHPGAYSDGSSLKKGMSRISKAVNAAFRSAPGKSMLLLETVAGGGRRIGSDFREIRDIIEKIKDKKRVGVCLDTAHTHAAGYDLSKTAGIDAMLRDFDSTIGLSRLKMIHFNDSLVPSGSKKDRHQHLGKGSIGLKGFARLVAKLGGVAEAGILETPKEPDGADGRNLRILFRMRK
ncbi:MAG: deoxyribonuclease IV [Endomicrobiales bacterium]|nr:deoxyribonuclease IV [Endomicrobiales bacterium]